jgi:hypothetical protein
VLYRKRPACEIRPSPQAPFRRSVSDTALRLHDLRHTFNTRLMEAGVLQEIRMALMGHSSGSKVHSIYTHIELPAKRKAIRLLESWVNQQQEELKKEHDNASTQTDRSETGPGTEAGKPKTLEEEITR